MPNYDDPNDPFWKEQLHAAMNSKTGFSVLPEGAIPAPQQEDPRLAFARAVENRKLTDQGKIESALGVPPPTSGNVPKPQGVKYPTDERRVQEGLFGPNTLDADEQRFKEQQEAEAKAKAEAESASKSKPQGPAGPQKPAPETPTSMIRDSLAREKDAMAEDVAHQKELLRLEVERTKAESEAKKELIAHHMEGRLEEQENQAEFDKEMTRRMSAIDRATEDAKQMRIDPNQAVKGMSSGAKSSFVVAGFLSGLGGHPEMAMKALDKQIDDNIDAQKAQLDNAWKGVAASKNALQMYQSATKDRLAAKHQLRADMYGDYADSLQNDLDTKYKSPEAQERGTALLAQVRQKQEIEQQAGAKRLQDVIDSDVLNRARAAKAAGGSGAMQPGQVFNQDQVVKINGVDHAYSTPQEARKALAMHNVTEDLKKNSAALKELWKDPTSAIPGTPAYKARQQQELKLADNMASANIGGGKPTTGQIELEKKYIGSPGVNGYDVFGSGAKALDSIVERHLEDAHTTVSSGRPVKFLGTKQMGKGKFNNVYGADDHNEAEDHAKDPKKPGYVKLPPR
jgi:hypothetical protein